MAEMKIDITDVIERAIEKIEAEGYTVQKWIPCSERLPEEAGEYLVCGRWRGEKPRTWICQFIILGGVGGFANPAKNPPISFWMPLPEPPEVTQDDR